MRHRTPPKPDPRDTPWTVDQARELLDQGYSPEQILRITGFEVQRRSVRTNA